MKQELKRRVRRWVSTLTAHYNRKVTERTAPSSSLLEPTRGRDPEPPFGPEETFMSVEGKGLNGPPRSGTPRQTETPDTRTNPDRQNPTPL